MLLLAPIVAIPLVAWCSGRLRIHAGLFLVASLLAIASFAAPTSIGDASWLDRRLPPMVALALCAAVLPQPATIRWRTVMAALLSLAILARIGWITVVWVQRDRDVLDLLAVIQAIKPGDAVIVVQQKIKNEKAREIGRNLVGATGGLNAVRRHLPAMLVPLRQAFIPTLFSLAGQQPIRVAPAMIIDSVPTSFIPSSEDIVTGSAKDPYLARWRCDFQYVLLIGADEPASVPFAVKGLERVATRGFASLYSVVQVNGAVQPCGPVVK